MVDVLTMDGLQPLRLGSQGGCTPVTIHSRVLGHDVTVCSEDAARALESAELPKNIGKKNRGRPKGSTVKHGAKRPRVPSCSQTEVVVSRKGKKICRCATPGNRQILPHDKCGLPKK